MTKVVFILLLLGIYLNIALSLDVCDDQRNFAKLIHPADCSKYIICRNGQINSILTCPSGKHFNRLTLTCDSPIEAACDVNIIKKSWADSGDCSACRSFCGCYADGECPSSPGTPATETPSPVTPSPVTPTPVTPSPGTPCPGNPSPATPSPETPAPETPSPTTPSPDTPATPSPGTPSPGTPSPGTPSPGTPVTPSPGTPDPETPSPATPSPGTPTPSPGTPAPGTTTPAKPSPETPSPVTPTPPPVTPSPGTPSPATPSPAIPSPATPSPATPSPETPSPATPSPETPGTPTPGSPSPGTPPTTPSPGSPSPATPATPSSCENDFDICVGKPDFTSLLVPGSCQNYAVCISGCANVLSCPNNLNYNTITQQCDYPQNVDCPYSHEPPSGPAAGPSGTSCVQPGKCAGQADGTLFAASNGYIVCQCECEIARPCPGGLVFNEAIGVCDFLSA